MAKKKEKTQVINNIQELNLEIDYDKLAEAIKKAQDKTEDEKITKGTFSLLASWILGVSGVCGTGISVYSFGYVWYFAFNILEWESMIQIITNVLVCLLVLIITVCAGALSVMFIGSAREIAKSKDKNFVVSVFSSLTGLIALFVALVALLKGVG